LTTKAPILSRYPDFEGLIADGEDEDLSINLRRAETIGRPVGDDAFIAALEQNLGRPLKRAKPGPRPKISALSP
jgi:putative transposase